MRSNKLNGHILNYKKTNQLLNRSEYKVCYLKNEISFRKLFMILGRDNR
jgi:hypothetical protein